MESDQHKTVLLKLAEIRIKNHKIVSDYEIAVIFGKTAKPYTDLTKKEINEVEDFAAYQRFLFGIPS